MKLTKKLEAEVLRAYHTYWNSYFSGDMSTFASLLDDNCHIIGSTAHDTFSNKKEAVAFYKATAKEIVGVGEYRNRKITLLPEGENVMVQEVSDYYFLDKKKWHFYGVARVSTLFSKKKGKWKIIHQHGSLPDPRADKGRQLGTEKITKENLRLKEAVKRNTVELQHKNRELEIEAALERVRAASMAMHKSEELQNVVSVVFEQLQFLDFALDGAAFIATKITNFKGFDFWMEDKVTKPARFRLPYYDAPSINDIYDAWGKRKKFLVKIYGKEKNIWFRYAFKHTDLKIVPEDRKKWVLAQPKLTQAFAIQKNSMIGIHVHHAKTLTENETDILIRFSKVFEQSFVRFRDLQKAEIQAREAEVQLALERVRARTMAMQKSEELSDTALLIHKQFSALSDLPEKSRMVISILNNETKNFDLYITTTEGSRLNRKFSYSIDEPHVFHPAYLAVKKKKKTFVIDLSGKSLSAYAAYMENTGYPVTFRERAVITCATFSNGYFCLITAEPVSGQILQLLSRFADGFDLTYTRFLDLQKAEAQAREAEIQLALERVRARTMAMHTSNELAEAASELFQQIIALGLKPVACAFIIVDEKAKTGEVFISADGTVIPDSFVLPYHGEPAQDKIFRSWKKKEPYIIVDLKGKKLAAHLEFIAANMPVGEMLEASGTAQPDRLALHIIHFRYGFLGINYPEPNVGAVPLLIRFAKVFEQTYTRFLDLQKAEAQAREARIEAALERVRSRSMAMHQTAELQDVIHTVHKELLGLNLAIEGGSFVVINDDVGPELRCWGSGGTADTSEEIRIPHFNMPFCTNLINGIKKGPGFFTEAFSREEKKAYFSRLFKEKPWSDLGSKQKKETLSASGGYTRSVAVSKYTSLFIINHLGKKFTASDNAILNRFARVFEQAYTRFLDLQKAEAQAREAQIQLALERVRARTMAMHKSDELPETSHILFEQMKELGEPVEQLTIGIIDEENSVVEISATLLGDTLKKIYRHSIDEPYMMNKIYKAWKKQQKTLVVELRGDELNAYNKYRNELTNSEIFPTNFGKEHRRIVYAAFFSKGMLALGANEPRPAESIQLLERFASVFDLTYTRFLDLQKAEAQTREAQIEAALERVRSRTMAMHHTSELQDVINTVHQQLTSLHIDISGGAFIAVNQESKDEVSCWGAGGTADYVERVHIPFFDQPIYTKFIEDIKKGPGLYTEEYSYEEKMALFEHLFNNPPYSEAPLKQKKEVMSRQGGYTRSLAVSRFTSVFIINHHGRKFTEEENTILVRFGKVFEQSYTRFLDLQKAEAQAREAEIELGLERVRARTMAMHSSGEMADASYVLFQELKKLGIESIRSGIGIIDYTINAGELWLVAETEGKAERKVLGYVTADMHPIYKNWFDAGRNKEPYIIQELEGDELKEYYETVSRHWNIPVPATFNHKEAYHGFFFPEGTVNVIALQRLSEDECNLVLRFAKVFGLIYRRFLDLQKAEMQAKEARIEAALEKVRSRTMAMQKSEDLNKAASDMFKEIQSLGMYPWACGFNIFDKDEKAVTQYMSLADGGISPPFRTPLTEDPFFINIYEARKRGDELLVWESKGESLAETYRYMFSLPGSGEIFGDLEKSGFEMPKFQITHCAYFSQGYLVFITYDPVPEAHDIFKRFAKVFDQTYTRFLDLQKAEAQAREAQIEAALERVRSRSLAMQKSDELIEVIKEVLLKFQELGITMESRVAVIIELDNDKRDLNQWVASPNFSATYASTPYTSHIILDDLWNAWESGVRFYSKSYPTDVKNSYFNYLFDHSAFRNFNNKEEAREWILAQEFYTLSLQFEKYSSIGIADYSGVPLADADIDIVKRFAKVFEQAYIRFLDLRTAELQAREAEIQLGLERVRARAMAMQDSEELKELIGTVFTELTKLDLELTRCLIMIFDNETMSSRWWMANSEEPSNPSGYFVKYHEAPPYHAYIKAWKEKQSKWEFILEGNEKVNWDEIIFSQTELSNLPDFVVEGMKAPDRVYLTASFNQFGCLSVASLEPLKEEHTDILQRFANTFNLTYTRFNDLQQAEVQRREAEIQLALERVRARTTAMHKSEELQEVASLLYKEFIGLGVSPFLNCGYVEVDEENHIQHGWMTHPDGTFMEKFNLPLTGEPAFEARYDAWKKQVPVFHQVVGGADLVRHIEVASAHFGSRQVEEMVKSRFTDPTIFYCGNFSKGYLHLVSGNLLTGEEESLLERFTRAFEMTYKRFLDLKKAEAQAREAQIQLALERVRARMMAMHKSDELASVAAVVFTQLKELDIDHLGSGFIIFEKDRPQGDMWMSFQGDFYPRPLPVDFSVSPALQRVYTSWSGSEQSFINLIEGGEYAQHIRLLQQLFGDRVNEVLEQTRQLFISQGKEMPEKMVMHHTFFKHGSLVLNNTTPVPDQDTLNRFAKVFEQSYIRFLDLQKAEAQTREAQIEAALERVRSRAMAMHSSEELQEVALELRKQMGNIGQKNLEVCAIHLYDEDENYFESWGAMQDLDGKIFQGMTKYPKAGLRIVDEMMTHYRNGDRDYVLVNEGEKGKEWLNAMKEYAPEAYAAIADSIDRIISDQLKAYWAVADFKGGALVMVTYTEPDEHSRSLLRRSANVFQLAYQRHRDLQRSEAQAREAQIEAALERVRSASLSMENTSDLQKVVDMVFAELNKLEIGMDHTAIVTLIDDSKDYNVWVGSADANFTTVSRIPYNNLTQVQRDYNEMIENRPTLLSKVYTGETKKEYSRYLFSQTGFKDNTPEKELRLMIDGDSLITSIVMLENTGIQIVSYRGHAFSDVDELILKRFSNVFEQAYIRFLDIKKSEIQAREAEIELGLERVRARTMAMQKSEELKTVVQTLSAEIRKLDVIFTRTFIVIYEPGTLASTWWMSNPETNESFGLFVKYHELHPYLAHLDAWRKRKKGWEYILQGEDKKQWDHFLFHETDLAHLPEHVKADMQGKGKVCLSCSFSNFGYLVLESPGSISPDQFDILYRFAKVFDLTYTRFLDIQKAEAQTREAQVETSLERVRAKAMAMHSSKHISETVDVFFKELKNLGITPLRCGVGQIDEESKTSNVSATTSSKQGDSYEVIGQLKLAGHPVLDEIFNHWKKQEEYHPLLKGKALTEYYKTMNPQVGFPDYPEEAVQYGSYFYFKEGLVFAWAEEQLSEEALRIFRRFTSVIALTYRRYMDLKEAEAQAREAQVEAALERIRGQAMAMRESNDLLDIVVTMRTEFLKLGHEAHYFWYMRWLPEKYEKAMTSGDGTRIGMIMELPRHIHGEIPLLADWEKGEEPTVVYAMDADAAVAYVDKMITLGDFKQVDPNAPGPDDIRHIGGLTFVMARTLHGEIGYSLPGVVTNPPREDLATLKRFTDVFDLAYRRFEDLQKAEASTREAIKQAVLDRIRADIASMRTVQDLDRIIPLIWNELKTLGVPFIRCGVFIMDEKEQLIHTFLSSSEGKAIAAFHLPYDTPGNISKVINSWKAGSHYLDHWGEEEFTQFADVLVKQGSIASREQYLATVPHEGFYLHFIPFLQGMLYVGNTTLLEEEKLNLLQSMADAFSTAYARYEDFNRLEAAKKQVESALNGLREAQKQLIQSEKMASLGELTAGIAHEIQNPLNFVNNFSDVSNELIQEMKEEFSKGNTEEAMALADEVRQNLEKILQHGKRADGIVKGMLQHSRSSSGQKEFTDINVLADEYLRLAYHGLRAKDKSFNAKFETRFDETIEKLNIVPQEIGRVILNMINNAFYACMERSRNAATGEDYQPMVTVSTGKLNGSSGREGVEISIKDNGNGIPESLKQKIFQPFFTTKPTGQGTGLGLSLSYDIVKAHGGNIELDSKENSGTTFTIRLPG